mgnify:CR=1 FL=1
MPTKEQVRKWMQDRQAQRSAPPSPEEIRRALGWGFLVNPKKQDR